MPLPHHRCGSGFASCGINQKTTAALRLSFGGAGDGNRTRVSGLGSGRSAIELRLHLTSVIIA